MSTGEHTHDWEYNDAKAGITNEKNKTISFSVIRFCKICLKIEYVELKDLKYK